jgi:abortive infection bacteriophage resistance protein
MPNLFISWGIEDLLKPAEYRLYNSLLTNDDKKIVKTFNVNDRFFSYAWLPSNKEIFNVFNKGLDK